MLSPGRHHLRIPKTFKENVLFRRHVMNMTEDDMEMRCAVMEACRQDIIFWIDVFGWQVNPRMIGDEIGPFILRPKQEEVLRKTMTWLYEQQSDVLWEKSRYQGATWLALFKDVWMSLFHSWKKFLWVSHTEKAVDSPADSDSLFWKVNFIHEMLPDWMSRGVQKRKLGFTYPATNSSINGAATTERAGVGGRATSIGLDEFSKQRDDFKILGQTADTGPRLFIGTHYGTGTAFHELTQRVDIHRCVMHWSESGDPVMTAGMYRWNSDTARVEILDKSYIFPDDYHFIKDGSPTGGPFPGVRSVWYDKECVRRNNARDVAMHLDINPKGSKSQWYDALMIQRLKRKAWEPLWIGEVHYDRESGKPISMVEMEEGRLWLWLNPTPEGRIPAAKYGIAADISEGLGSTPSCLSIIRLATGEKVGEYVSANIDPTSFASMTVALCQLFKDEDNQGALLIWEQQGPGNKFAKQVLDLRYRHLFYRYKEFDRTPIPAKEPGWYPGAEAKLRLHQDYRAALSDGSYTNPSERALAQCLDYRYDGNGNPEHPGQKQTEDPAAGRVNHGDIVVADALGWLIARKSAETKNVVKSGDEIPLGSLADRRRMYEMSQLDEVWR